ncbi:MAG: hypothetical protein AAF490_16060 [Chloroflexota bacterium]
MPPQNDFSELEEALKKTTPPPTRMNPQAKAQLRQALLNEAEMKKRPFFTQIQTLSTLAFLGGIILLFIFSLRIFLNQPVTGTADNAATTSYKGQSITLPLDQYPPSTTPYRIGIEEGVTFWLINDEGTLHIFNSWSPMAGGKEPCTYSWIPANNRFEDPCSGDKWSLTGQLSLEHSYEFWSNRDLDQHPFDVRKDEITIYFEENILGTIYYPTEYGSKAAPNTNADFIVEQVNELASRWLSEVTSKNGWFYSESKVWLRGLDSEALLAQWYDLQDGGTYQTSFIQSGTTTNDLQDQTAIFNGYIYHFTIDGILEKGQLDNEYEDLGTRFLLNRLKQETELSSELIASMHVVYEQGKFILTVQLEHIHPSGLLNDQYPDVDNLILAEVSTFHIDLETGKMLDFSHFIKNESDEQIRVVEVTNLNLHFIEAPPSEVLEQLAQVEQLLLEQESTTVITTPESAQIFTRNDVKFNIDLSIWDVRSSESESQMNIVAIVDPDVWGLDLSRTPPQPILPINSSLILPEGESPAYQIGYESGIPFESNGSLEYTLIPTFPENLAVYDRFTFETAVELHNLNHSHVLFFDFTSRQEGDSWDTNIILPLGHAGIRISNIFWVRDLGNGNAEIRITVDNSSSEAFNIRCLQVETTGPVSNGCREFDSTSSFLIEVPITTPATLNVRSTIQILEPFVLSWEIQE